VGHEVEASSQEDHVDENLPVASESNLALLDKGFADAVAGLADALALNESIRLAEEQSEDDEQDWDGTSEPEQRAPAVRSSVDERAGEGGGKQVAEGITLLKHTGDDTTSTLWAVLEGRCSNVSVQATHGNAKKRTNCQKLLISGAKASAKLKSDEEKVVDDERPLSSVPISGDTEDDGADGTEHQNQRDTPGDVGRGDGPLGCREVRGEF
jgi:hypothetical protein